MEEKTKNALTQAVKNEYRRVARYLQSKGNNVTSARVWTYDINPVIEAPVCELIVSIAGAIGIQGSPRNVQAILEDKELAEYGLRGEHVKTQEHFVGTENHENDPRLRSYEGLTEIFSEATGKTFDEQNGLVSLIGKGKNCTLFIEVGNLESKKSPNRKSHGRASLGYTYDQVVDSEAINII